jgi:hypothetical protein
MHSRPQIAVASSCRALLPHTLALSYKNFERADLCCQGFFELLTMHACTVTLATKWFVEISHVDSQMQAMVQLTLAVKQRPFSAVLRLSLAGLHWLLGNVDAALAQFRALSVRQVQLDSLSHHVLPAIAQFGAASHEHYLTSVRSPCTSLCSLCSSLNLRGKQ